MTKSTVWVVDDDASIRWVLDKALSTPTIEVTCFDQSSTLLAQLPLQPPDLIISDIRMPDIDGLTLLTQIHQQCPKLPVIIITAHSDLDTAVNAYQSGAFEYLPKPFDIDEVVAAVQKALDQVKELKRNRVHTPIAHFQTDIIGEAPSMQEVFRAIGRLSRAQISVLINGQSGTGKELVAKALHKHSPRADKPFIALNMAAIPKDLIESELFGHEKGAFTGANTIRHGRFAQADGGTLFLDEIGDMPIEVQTRLLRVLADGEFYRVGGHSPLTVNVRIIAATHQNLEVLVNEGRFRDDLFHRLNVVRIHLPALKERRQDIAKLTHYFLHRAADELDLPLKTISKAASSFLTTLDWPGNVRQLENICRGLTVMASGNEIQMSDLPIELRHNGSQTQSLKAPLQSHPEFGLSASSPESDNNPKPIDNLTPEQGNSLEPRSSLEPINSLEPANSESRWQYWLAQAANEQLNAGKHDILSTCLPQFERILLQTALSHCEGKKQLAATRLGWGRNTLTRKLKELNIVTESAHD